jgi:type I restriction enzyme, S subunit
MLKDKSQRFWRSMKGFVKTEIGLLPGTWPVQRLGDVFETQLGKMLSQKAHGGDAPKAYLRNKNVQWGSIDTSDMFEMDFSEGEKAKFQLRPGDLLVCEGGVPGRAAIWDGSMEECYYQKALHRLRPRNGMITNEFMLYWLWYSFELRNLYGVAGASSTISHLPEIQLKALPVPVPPLAEQHKIASLVGLIKQAIEQQERLIALTTELKKSLLHRLFTRGLHGEPQKQTAIGPVPQSWPLVTIHDVCSLVSGGTPSKQKPEFWSGCIPWASPKDMKKPRLSNVADHISEAALQDGSSLAPASAVFVVIRGMILAKDVPIALSEVPMAFNQDMKAIIPGPRIHPSFLLYALAAFKQHLFWKVGRSAHGTMTLMSTELAQFKIPLPDKRTQRKVAKAIETIERAHERHQHKRTALASLFRTLLHQLMTAAIRVDQLDLSILQEVQ